MSIKSTIRTVLGFALITLSFCLLSTCSHSDDLSVNWESYLETQLPEYGHRNWIVVADSAYPKQSAPGIKTIYTGGKQMDVLKKVLAAIDEAAHVQPTIMLDKELDLVTESAAPGVQAYRDKLKGLFGSRSIDVMPHEDIIRELDEGSKLFNVLLLKTDMVIPYTSVFLRLECGYWDADKEKALRKAFQSAQ